MRGRLALALVVSAAVAAGDATPTPHVTIRPYTLPPAAVPGGSESKPLHGVIGIPGGAGEHPLVVIVPGTDAGARGSFGFEYLVRALARRGFLALAYDGVDGIPGTKVYDRHLKAVAGATRGERGPFGASLEGRVDLGRIGLIGYSQGAAAASHLATARSVDALMLVAAVPPKTRAQVPVGADVAVVLPSCDGLAEGYAGGKWYEAARLSAKRKGIATQVVVNGANHGFFDGKAGSDDGVLVNGRADCEDGRRLSRIAQRAWLERYALAFFRVALDGAAPQMAGLDPAAAAPRTIFGTRVITALTVSGRERLVLQYPRRPANARVDAFGRRVRLVGAIAVETTKALELELAWSAPGASYAIQLPSGRRNLGRFTAISVRAAIDPTDELNRDGRPQSFSIVVRDMYGGVARAVATRSEPALAYPRNDPLETRPATANVLGSIRIPLRRFAGVDLTNVASIALVFDRVVTGALLVQDLELVAEPERVRAIRPTAESPVVAGTVLRLPVVIDGRGAPTLTASVTDQTGIAVESRKIGPLLAGRREIGLALPGLAPGAYRVRLAWRGAVESRPFPFRVVRPVDASVVSIVRGAGRRVALTFDDCVYSAAWASMLTTLRRFRAHASFFCNGRNLEGQSALMRRTVQDGHSLGSHTWGHRDLRLLSTGAIERQTGRESDVWWQAARAETRPFLRPPYGSYDAHVLAAAGTAGHRYIVLWDIDTNDWQRPGAAVIAKRALLGLRPGAIVLLHVLPQTAEALPAILDGLHRRGLRAASLNELLAAPGARPSKGHWSPVASAPVRVSSHSDT
jgi:peptidoglycan/xylan/chitin deacetylase (PgdA/CDA1 family)/dienelactone hydrolase